MLSQKAGMLLHDLPRTNPLNCSLLLEIHSASRYKLGHCHSFQSILRRSTTLTLMIFGDIYIEGLPSHGTSLPSPREFVAWQRRCSRISYLIEAWRHLTTTFHLTCHTSTILECSQNISSAPPDCSWVDGAFGY